MAALGSNQIVGIEEGHDTATAEQILVDRPLRFISDSRRVDHEENVDGGIDFGGGQFDRFDFVLALDGLIDSPCRLAATAEGHGVAGHLERGHQTDDFFLLGGNFSNAGTEPELDAVLVHEGGHQGRCPWNEGSFIETGNGDAEKLIPLRLDAGGGGVLFFIGSRFDDEFLDFDEFRLHFMIPLEPTFDLPNNRAELGHQVIGGRDIELDSDVGVDAFEDFFSAFGKGVNLVLCEVEIGRTQAEKPVHSEKDGSDDGNASASENPRVIGADGGGITGRERSAHF